MSASIEEIMRRDARSYADFPKYQRLAYALRDIKILLTEVQLLDAWGQGLEAAALRWAIESNDLRKELELANAENKSTS